MGILSAFSPINNTEKKKDQNLLGGEEDSKASLEDIDGNKWEKENVLDSPMIVSSSVQSSAQRKVFGSSTLNATKTIRTSFTSKAVESLAAASTISHSKETPQSKVADGASISKKRITRSSSKALNKLVQAELTSEDGPFIVDQPLPQQSIVNVVAETVPQRQLPSNFADLDQVSILIRTIIREEIEEFKTLALRDIRNLHIDMLKGNTLLDRSMERALARHLPTIGELLKELEHLRNENKRLKLRFCD